MPQTVTKTIPVSQLRRGDLLNGKAVTEISNKTPKGNYSVNYRVLVDGSTTPKGFRATDEVEVQRVELTEAEKEAQMRTFRNASILKNIEQAKAQLEAQRAKLTGYFDKNYVVGYSELQGLVTAQCDADIYAQVENLIDDEHDAVAAQEIVIAQLTERLIRNYDRGGSTNEMSNAMDAIKRERASHFLTWASR